MSKKVGDKYECGTCGRKYDDENDADDCCTEHDEWIRVQP